MRVPYVVWYQSNYLLQKCLDLLMLLNLLENEFLLDLSIIHFDLIMQTIDQYLSREFSWSRKNHLWKTDKNKKRKIFMFTEPRKSSTFEFSSEWVRADWALSWTYRSRLLKPWTWFNFLAASITKISSSWSQISKWNVSLLLLFKKTWEKIPTLSIFFSCFSVMNERTRAGLIANRP